MKRFAVLGFCFLAGADLLALLLADRRLLGWLAGGGVALLLLAVRRAIGRDVETRPDPTDPTDPGDALRRWLSGTETLIHWSESTRQDWDRHLRPILARRFEMATGQRRAKDPAAFEATGRMLLGTDLWGWVNPVDVARSGGHEPGPGRTALEDILQRLEQV